MSKALDTACGFRDETQREPILGTPHCSRFPGTWPSLALCGHCPARDPAGDWRKLPLPAPRRKPDGSAILITAGIGDFLALDSHTCSGCRARVRHVAYATRAHRAIRGLIEANPAYAGVKSHEVLTEDFGPDRFCFFSAAEAAHALGEIGIMERYEDWSITQVFPRIAMGERKFRGSSFLFRKDAPAPPYDPDWPYLAIHPYSPNDRREARDFTAADWDWLIGHLERTDRIGVVLGTGTDPVPRHRRLANLTDRLTLAESIAVMEHACGFVGIASCLSVLAAQRFPAHGLWIKGSGSHLRAWKHVYYAPHPSFPFVRDKLTYDPLSSYEWRPFPCANS